MILKSEIMTPPTPPTEEELESGVYTWERYYEEIEEYDEDFSNIIDH